MDVLFKFNVLKTAISAITKEITDKIGRVGSSWHFCLFIWTLYFGIAEIKEDYFRFGPASAVIFIGASLYLVFTDYTEKLFTFDYFKALASACLYVSLPFVAFHYVWKPLNTGTGCILNKLVGQCDEKWSRTVSIVLALFFTILLIIHQRRKVRSNEKETITPASATSQVKRRKSARILARKQKQQQNA